MAQTPRSSFIPKQSVSPVTTRTHRKGKFNVLGFIAAILLIGSLAAAGGVFVYKDFYLTSKLETERKTFDEARVRISDADIERVRELDRQINAAKFLLESHRAPSRVLTVLEATTKASVQFTSFTLTKQPSGDMMLTLAGITDDFKKVALQSREFGDNTLLANTLFGGLAVSEVGDDGESGIPAGSYVQFSVSGTLPGSGISYIPASEEEIEEASIDAEAVETGSTTVESGAADEVLDGESNPEPDEGQLDN